MKPDVTVTAAEVKSGRLLAGVYQPATVTVCTASWDDDRLLWLLAGKPKRYLARVPGGRWCQAALETPLYTLEAGFVGRVAGRPVTRLLGVKQRPRIFIPAAMDSPEARDGVNFLETLIGELF